MNEPMITLTYRDGEAPARRFAPAAAERRADRSDSPVSHPSPAVLAPAIAKAR